VQYYNTQKKTDVSVLGWDEAKQDGQFVGSFEDQKGGQRVAQGLVSQGADILFPVAGPAGLGGLQAAKASSGKVNAIWVDTDGCVSAAEYCPILLSSVEKAMDVAVAKTVTDAYHKQFSNAAYVGTLANKGVSLAPYHQFDATIPADLKSEITALSADIAAGKVKIQSKAQPTS
jgi:basic membrane protein A and related proteins